MASPPESVQNAIKKANEYENKKYGVKDTNYINNRLLHSLFLGNLDAEEVVATISDFDEAFASQVNTGFRITTTRKDGMGSPGSIYSVLSEINNEQVLPSVSSPVIGSAAVSPKLSPAILSKKTFSVDKGTPIGSPKDIAKRKSLSTLNSATTMKSLSSSEVKALEESKQQLHDKWHRKLSTYPPSPTKTTFEVKELSNDDAESTVSSLISSSPLQILPEQKGWLPSINGNKIEISNSNEEKYFGIAAKADFYNQFRAMNRQKLIFSGTESSSGNFSHEKSVSNDNLSQESVECRSNNIWGDNFDLFSSMDEDLLSHYTKNYYSTSRGATPSQRSRPATSEGASATSLMDGNSIVSSLSGDDFTEGKDVLPQVSPRTTFIGACIRDGINPIPKVILRPELSTKLSLGHYGIGDALGKNLAESLKDLPCVESIDLSDNSLTDASLQYLVTSIAEIATLRELDLSRNKIDGECSDSLADYLSRADCPILKLTLQAADVDDGECFRFVQALSTNQNLKELDLSHNKLGSSEAMKTVMNNVPTGGEALAKYIKSDSCRLHTLKVAWNSIRLESAKEFCRAVAFNSTLTYIDLSYNGIGQAAGEILGDSLLTNKTLQYLDLTNNNINHSACFTICAAVQENFAMKDLVLSENPIGELGAKALMQIPIMAGTRVSIKASKCNTSIRDDSCWFDYAFPCKQYSLNLEREFDRAIAFSVLQIAASHQSYIMASAHYNGQPLRLVQHTLNDKVQWFDDNQKQSYQGLKRILAAASDMEQAKQLFLDADLDQSGYLDKDELLQVMSELGFVMSEEKLDDVFAVFDVDGAGVIGLDDFGQLVHSQAKEASQRLQEMVEYQVMVLEGTIYKYVPPKTGTLKLNLVDGYKTKLKKQVITSCDQENAVKMARSIGDINLIAAALANTKIRFTEAFHQYKQLYSTSGNMCESLGKLLPLLATSHDARMLISKATKDDPVQLSQVKKALGTLLKPILGSFNGYYCLNLSKELDRVCLSRLFEQSILINNKRSYETAEILGHGNLGDLSQNGSNWSSFRNAIYKGNSCELSPSLFSPIPSNGILEFDFSGSSRPDENELVLSDEKVVNILKNLCLLPADSDLSNALKQLSTWRKASLRGELKKGQGYSMCEISKETALIIGRAKDKFYEDLESRRNQYTTALRDEDVQIDYMNQAQEANLFVDEISDFAKDQSGILLLKRRLKALLNARGVSDNAKASRVAEAIEETFGRLWIRARHLALIIQSFSIGAVKKTESFGSYHVDVICSLFGRVIDVHNFELLYSILLPEDIACVMTRLGLLNVFNALKPEGCMEYNLSRYEDRFMAKIILALTEFEPGVNLSYKAFFWDRDTEVGGFEVTQPWLTDEGLPTKGFLLLQYFSGNNIGANGCKPNVLARLALLKSCLISETDVLPEASELPPDFVKDNNKAVKEFVIRNISIWKYLLPSKKFELL